VNEKLAKKPKKQRNRAYNNAPKPTPTLPSTHYNPSRLYILENPTELLGVFSTLSTASAAASVYGATSRNLGGWNDDGIRVYGNLVRILPKAVQRSKDMRDEGKEAVTNKEALKEPARIETVHLALDNAMCLGIFTEKTKAWDACLKHKTQMTYSVELRNEKKWVDKDGMPHVKGNIGGSGMHCWHVKVYRVDEVVERGRRRS
jgi:hypothetical protein